MRSFARSSIVLAVGAIVALTFAGQSRAADDTVLIGLEVPLSPPGDVQAGQLIRRGADLAVTYVNEQQHGVLGGRKIAIAVEDTSGQTEPGVAAYRRLVTEQHAVAVTGFYHSSVNVAVNEVAKDLGVATLGTQTSAADITAKHYEPAFRTHVIDPVRVEAWMDFIKRMHYKRISLIAETTDYGIGLVKETQRQNDADHAGLDIQAITFDHNATDLTPQLLQIKAFKPDLVINIGVGQPGDLIIDGAHTLGLFPQTPMLFSYDGPIRPQFWKLHPQDGVGLYFIAYYSPQQKLSPAGAWFAKAYESAYHEAPVYSSLNGFGDVYIIAQAVGRAKSADPKAIVKALETGTYQSWTSTAVTFPNNAPGVLYHNWSPPVLILQYTQPNQDWKQAKLVLEHSGKT
ncbi:MAG: ABC transporter substrate-binding protein [Vulcanimicrobiaceae bacterium]